MDCDVKCGAHRVGRRAALELGLCLALTPHLALAQTDPARERPHEGDLLVAVTAGSGPAPLKPDDLPLDGKQTFAWPMEPESKTVRSGSRLNKVLLLRLDPEGFDPETKAHAAEGVVAYSAVCTHTGCDVINRHPDSQLLECPCLLDLRSEGRSQSDQWAGATPPAGAAVEDRRRAARRRKTIYRTRRVPTNVIRRSRRDSMPGRCRFHAVISASALALALSVATAAA